MQSKVCKCVNNYDYNKKTTTSLLLGLKRAQNFVPTTYVKLATNVHSFFRQNEIQKVGLMSPFL